MVFIENGLGMPEDFNNTDGYSWMPKGTIEYVRIHGGRIIPSINANLEIWLKDNKIPYKILPFGKFGARGINIPLEKDAIMFKLKWI